MSELDENGESNQTQTPTLLLSLKFKRKNSSCVWNYVTNDSLSDSGKHERHLRTAALHGSKQPVLERF